MNNKHNWHYAFLLSLLLLLPAVGGECYDPAPSKDIPTSFGFIKLPGDAYVIEYDLRGIVDSYNKAYTTDETELLRLQNRMKETMGTIFSHLNIYQIVINDGDSYHTAFAAAFSFDADFFRRNRIRARSNKIQLKEEYIYQLALVQEDIKNSLDMYAARSKTAENPRRISVLNYTNLTKKTPPFIEEFLLFNYEWPTIEAAHSINGGFGFKTSFDFAGSLLGIILDNYSTLYVYNADEKSVGCLFFSTTDSERSFWEPIFAETVNFQPLI